MCPLRRVEGDQAGPAALGILVPPGRRTFVILRPRLLSLDLLLLRSPSGPDFRDLSQAEAQDNVRGLYQALEEWAEGGPGRVEVLEVPRSAGCWVRAAVGPYFLLACARQPGHPYAPQVFATPEAARVAAANLSAILCPARAIDPEVYFNTRHFAPSA